MAETKPIKPMGGGRRGQMRPQVKLENPGKTFRRLMGIVMKRYGFQFVLVAVCVIVNVCRLWK